MKKRVLTFLCIVFLLTACNQSKKEEYKSGASVKEITIDGLKNELIKLKEGKSGFDVTGITSNGTDCIYFINNGDTFTIEFEAMTADQVPFLKKLKAFAATNGFKTLKTASKKKPLYETDEFAPVICILTNTSLDETVVIAEKIQTQVFGNSKSTTYDVVP
ncbi:hypothetical protein [Flavobacterium cerinum]|uniref:Lipoprotein n=1 Tax=Flavobacterium cerinum TaxID=2502784 RepID=A0A444HE99_9FLAO|nr:hypothetical protein [Flavobacterium cerinum]RWX02526.1 hypothetical protein EPI11_04725 [Flavobacterium cerinum]